MRSVGFRWIDKAILVKRLPIIIEVGSVAIVASDLDFLAESVERFTVQGLRLNREHIALVSCSLAHPHRHLTYHFSLLFPVDRG